LPSLEKEWQYPISQALKEDFVWRVELLPLLGGLAENALRICEYGFSEILNNAIEHSEGSRVSLSLALYADLVTIGVRDDGVGIFNKIRRAYELDDARHAVLELAKGKLSTDPQHHSGEGIFFTSRMFDQFVILSGRLAFTNWNEEDLRDSVLVDADEDWAGTRVLMQITPHTRRTTREVFDQYTAHPEEYGFDRTLVPVNLIRYGTENLVSRSQARRLLARFERFSEVVLDFNNVTSIGQAFADEIFRVFAREHPEVHLSIIHVAPEVQRMIRHVTVPAGDGRPT
jgi:anti-sigma regulatory factor (Ser/Thr protein kinase)